MIRGGNRRSSLATIHPSRQAHGTPVGGCRVPMAAGKVVDIASLESAVEQVGLSLFPQFLNTEQAASVLGISPSTLNRWAARRDAGEEVGPPFRAVSDKVRRWSTDELLAWLDAQKR